MSDKPKDLTAAAEVGPTEYVSDDISWMRRKGISTASEIIERANKAIDHATVNATIERCAQVADKMCISDMSVAAAIRALKEKP